MASFFASTQEEAKTIIMEQMTSLQCLSGYVTISRKLGHNYSRKPHFTAACLLHATTHDLRAALRLRTLASATLPLMHCSRSLGVLEVFSDRLHTCICIPPISGSGGLWIARHLSHQQFGTRTRLISTHILRRRHGTDDYSTYCEADASFMPTTK